MTDLEQDHVARLRPILALVLLAVVSFGIADLVLDRPAHWLTAHVLFEAALIALSLGCAVFLWRGWRHAARSLAVARRSLAERQAERDAWRSEARSAIEGLAREIDRQFGAWRLTPAEREVALRLLKGHSHKQIAHETGRSERTVRQHATVVYDKAGLGGRAELAAFFLGDLEPPEQDAAEPLVSSSAPYTPSTSSRSRSTP